MRKKTIEGALEQSPIDAARQVLRFLERLDENKRAFSSDQEIIAAVNAFEAAAERFGRTRLREIARGPRSRQHVTAQEHEELVRLQLAASEIRIAERKALRAFGEGETYRVQTTVIPTAAAVTRRLPQRDK